MAFENGKVVEMDFAAPIRIDAPGSERPKVKYVQGIMVSSPCLLFSIIEFPFAMEHELLMWEQDSAPIASTLSGS